MGRLGPNQLIDQGPVVQNFVSVTLSLSPQFVSYLATVFKSDTLLFLVGKI